MFAVAVAGPLAGAETAARFLEAAGNAEDESARLTELRALSSRSEALLDAPARAELAALLPVVEAWAEGRTRAVRDVSRGTGEVHRYLHDFFNRATLAFAPAFPTPPRETSPLYPLWAFYRARFLAWVMIEDSSVSRVPENFRRFVGEAERCFNVARAAYPRNSVLRIYAGENLPAPGLPAPDRRAPDWANAQRRALTQLHRIIRWWIAERQLANGEFGGKWGDDVEMWRWWAPVLIGFDDPAVNGAQERLAHGNLSRPGLAGGYTSFLTDVEHTAEETADTLTPMQHVAGDRAEWATRTRRLLELADRVWWGPNERGGLQFKQIDFNHERLGSDVSRAYDTGYHVRVMQPVLLLWQRTGDPAIGGPLTRWLRTWADAALGTDNGKPAGIVPAALRWPTGQPGSAERGWVGPNLAGDPMESVYSWPAHPVASMTAALLQASIQTGEPVYLEPLLRMAAIRRAHLAAGDPDGPPGSAAWAAHRLPAIVNDPLAKWRQVTGDDRFDDLLRADANGYVRYVLTGDTGALARELAATATTLGCNWPMFTSEVRYTDRVLSFPAAWPRTIATGVTPVDAAQLYSSVTGDPGSVVDFPLNGVRWHTLPTDIAVLVSENRRDRFAAELHQFGDADRPLAASLLLLEPGTYAWKLSTAKGVVSSGEKTIAAADRRLEFALPPHVDCRLSLSRKP